MPPSDSGLNTSISGMLVRQHDAGTVDLDLGVADAATRFGVARPAFDGAKHVFVEVDGARGAFDA